MQQLLRVVVGIAVIELALAGLWWWLMQQPGQKPEAPAVIGQVMGGAMGLVAALGVALFAINFAAARKR